MKSKAELFFLVLLISMCTALAAPALAQGVDDSNAIASVAEVADTCVSSTESHAAEDSLSIKGGFRKRRSILGKIASLAANLFLGGDYADGYSSFVSY